MMYSAPFCRLAGRGRRAGSCRRARRALQGPVHSRRPAALCARRLPRRGHPVSRQIRQSALDPGLLNDAYGLSLERYKFHNFLKEVYLDSDTKIGLLSGAPFDNQAEWFLTNDQIRQAAELVNSIARSKRLLFHSVITPKQPGWMEEVDRCIEVVKPNSWKGYTIGDPLNVKTTKY